MQCANENLRSDLERWHVEKKKDIRNLLLCMANQQIQYYEDVSFHLLIFLTKPVSLTYLKSFVWIFFIVLVAFVIMGASYTRSQMCQPGSRVKHCRKHSKLLQYAIFSSNSGILCQISMPLTLSLWCCVSVLYLFLVFNSILTKLILCGSPSNCPFCDLSIPWIVCFKV